VTLRTRRPLRPVAAGVGLLGSAVLLTGCDKPQPSITVFSDNRSGTVAAQPACTVLGSCQPIADRVAQIQATGGSQILLDVPKQLSDGGWIVAAYTSDGSKNTALTTPGASSPPIQSRHSVRLQVPSATSGSYYLQVTALKPSNQLTTWLVGVRLTQ
jgi:hypothetical protein